MHTGEYSSGFADGAIKGGSKIPSLSRYFPASIADEISSLAFSVSTFVQSRWSFPTWHVIRANVI